jgi:hypothetical protein
VGFIRGDLEADDECRAGGEVSNILAILRSALWLVIRFFVKRDEPEAVRKRAQNEIDKAVTSGDEARVNVLLDDAVERVRSQTGGGKK